MSRIINRGPDNIFRTIPLPSTSTPTMADTRITTTNTGQYDLLLAVSQDSINSALAALWDLDGDNMTAVEIDGADFGIVGSISGEISSPDIQVIASGAGRGSVLFRMTFIGGDAKLWNSNLKKSEKKALKGFQLAFKVDIGELCV